MKPHSYLMIAVLLVSAVGCGAERTERSSDRTPPDIILNAPSSAVAGSTVTAVAHASDDVGIAQVDFLCDAVEVKESTVEPHSVDCRVPDILETHLIIRAIAIDTSGNSNDDTARVLSKAASNEKTP